MGKALWFYLSVHTARLWPEQTRGGDEEEEGAGREVEGRAEEESHRKHWRDQKRTGGDEAGQEMEPGGWRWWGGSQKKSFNLFPHR